MGAGVGLRCRVGGGGGVGGGVGGGRGGGGGGRGGGGGGGRDGGAAVRVRRGGCRRREGLLLAVLRGIVEGKGGQLAW